MRCHVCNVEVGEGQRFCHGCGEDLHRVTMPTQPIEMIDSDDPPVRESGVVLDLPPTAEIATTSEQVAAPSIGEVDAALTDDARADDSRADDVSASGWTDETTRPYAPTESLTAIPDATTPTDDFVFDAFGDRDDGDDVRVGQDVPALSGFEATTTMPIVEGSAPADAITKTDELPVQSMHGLVFDGVGDVDEYTVSTSSGFTLRVSFVLGLLAVVAVLMAGVADVIDIRTSRPVAGILVGIRLLDDFGSNLAIAGFVGVAVMLLGGLLSCFGLRWGAGLAGGAGLAVSGWAALALGLIEVPIHTAEGVTLTAPADANGFTLAVTRDIGWFLVVAVGVLGVLVFASSLRMAGTGGRRGLNPWTAAVGALGALILAVGPLVALGDATFDLNLGFVGLPRVFFAGRLVQLGLIALTGVVGFLSVRTYGLGFAAGGVSVAAWLWATSLFDIGDRPLGVASGNIGSLDTSPHAITTVGLSVTVVMLLAAASMSSLRRRS